MNRLNKRLLIVYVFIVFVAVTFCLVVATIDRLDQHGYEPEEIETETQTQTETETEMVTETITETETDPETETETIPTTAEGITADEFRLLGVIKWNGYRWKYYSEKVRKGQRLNIPGRTSDEYFVRDGEGNICVASSELKWGTYIETPFGMGRVYDSGCKSGTFDIYVSGRWGK